MLVHQILRQHRLNLEYQAKPVIAEMSIDLQISIDYKFFKRIEEHFVQLTDNVLTAWLDALDISTEHHAWFLQAHHREISYAKLVEAFPTKDKTLLKRLADLITLMPDLKAIKAIWEVSGAAIVENTLFKPRFVEIILDEDIAKRNE